MKEIEKEYVLIIFTDGWAGKPFDKLYRIDSIEARGTGISIVFDGDSSIEVEELSLLDTSIDGLFTVESHKSIVVIMKDRKIYPRGRVSIIYGNGLDVPN
ncbi:hypothetical protein AFCDBAGC_3500 [Methylobacterium cerastii]|uniref:Uncharacterized protein n=1 Tax=Methylobacterium cerastii TaxID=932741 RepID=A0ABQ4QKQ6_9HYPH|nr:hypothetical protein [Methylobacterium cerastii]GJD45626.1 hypothetical protein AFCDBAGC_3500 [Methylobacterium cerastii]